MPFLVRVALLASTPMLIVPKSLSAMEPSIDSDATLKLAADTRVVLKELQDDLAACMAIPICFPF